MRYVGQGHEIAVPLPVRHLAGDDVAMIRAAYDAEYTKFYNRPVPGSDIEVMSYAVTVTTMAPILDRTAAEPLPHRAAAAGARKVLDTATGLLSDWTLYERGALAPGARIDGPAIVAEAETSTLVGPGWSGRITGEGYIELSRRA
jgi:N-methylhydantoinase A